MCELIEFIQSRPNVTLGGILESWRDTKFKHRLQELSFEEEVFNKIEVTTKVFHDAIKGLIKSNIKEFELLKKELIVHLS